MRSDLPPRCRPVDYIIELTAAMFKVGHEDIVGLSRLQKYAGPRQIAMMLARELLGFELVRIGKVFDRHHTTVFDGIERGRERVRDDAEIADKAQLLRDRLVHDLELADDVRDQVLATMLEEALITGGTCTQLTVGELHTATVNRHREGAMSSVERIEV